MNNNPWLIRFQVLLFSSFLAYGSSSDTLYDQILQDSFSLQQETRSVLTQIRLAIEKNDMDSPGGRREIEETLFSVKNELELIVINENGLLKEAESYYPLEDNVARKEEIRRLLITQENFRGKVAVVLNHVKQVLSETDQGQKYIEVTGQAKLGVGKNYVRSNARGIRSFTRLLAELNSLARFSEKLSSSLNIAYNKEVQFSPFSTTDVSTSATYQSDQLRLQPTLGYSKYDDFETNSLDYERYQIGLNEEFKFEDSTWSLFGNHFYNHYNHLTSEDYNILTLDQGVRNKTKTGTFEVGFGVLSRSNPVTTTLDFTTLSPRFLWKAATSGSETRTLKVQAAITSYSTNSAAQNTRINSSLFYDKKLSDGKSKLSGPTLTVSHFPNATTSGYIEPGYESRLTQYDSKTGFEMDQTRAYYHHGFGAGQIKFININNLETRSGKKVWKVFKTKTSTQNNYRLSLAFSSPHSGEQSWEHDSRPALIYYKNQFTVRLGAILGWRFAVDLSDYDAASKLRDVDPNAQSPFAALIKNSSDFARYGLNAQVGHFFDGPFEKSQPAHISFRAEFVQKIFFFARPVTRSNSLQFSFDLGIPVAKDLEVGTEIFYNRSNTFGNGTSGDPFTKYGFSITIAKPFNLFIPI